MVHLMISVAAVIASVALLGASSGGILWVLRRSNDGPAPAQDATGAFLETLAARVAALEVTVDGLPSLWEEERQRAVKAQKRAEEAARSLARKREDDEDEPDDDWEGPDVQQFDAFPGEPERMQPMPTGLGGHPTPAILEAARQRLGWLG